MSWISKDVSTFAESFNLTLMTSPSFFATPYASIIVAICSPSLDKEIKLCTLCCGATAGHSVGIFIWLRIVPFSGNAS